ncbi:unnamed protein product [Eruca vesicaria subsp. sativa]|uniref:Uncharacterized protein n=1 Tax=Eruca vesicaria subsp. sativa TaxID=29727 RepID=A0ABC8J926_ERUVS|nr:unnamed protein product [Eruca vesicaria subsp. sativa]
MQSQQDTVTPFQILGDNVKVRGESLLSLVSCATCLARSRWKIHILLNKKLESYSGFSVRVLPALFFRIMGLINDGFVGIAAPYFARISPVSGL